MASPKPHFLSPHFTPPSLSYLLTLTLFLSPISSLNITSILSHYPDLSDFTSLLSSTAVAGELSGRSAVTLLAVPNSHLSSASSADSADVLRCHVLLRYLTWSDLRQIPPAGTLIPTLFQTTGRAVNDFGSVNLTFNPSNGVVLVHPTTPNASFVSVVSLVKSFPYNLSIFTVSSLFSPYGFGLMASESGLPPPPPVNITKALFGGHDFNVAAAMLAASGVVGEFEKDEGGAGITLFVPTDEAFANLPGSVQLQALPAERKGLVLKFHVLHSYYPLGSLESIVNPVQPTLATEDSGAGSFTLNISRVNRTVEINTGLVQAEVTQTVFDQNPVAIFGVSNVLLPREIFGSGKSTNVNLGAGANQSSGGSGGFMAAPPHDIGVAPDTPPEFFSPPSHLLAPPGLRQDISSEATRREKGSLANWGMLLCTGIFYLFQRQ